METGIAIVLFVIAFIAFRYLRKIPLDLPLAPQTEKVDQTIPDFPLGFGYKCAWFAVKTNNAQKLAELLEIKDVSICNWKAGIYEAYEGSVFITPPIDGWTLAPSSGFAAGDSIASVAWVKQILQVLSQEFGHAQFFCTFRVVEFHSWMMAVNGTVTRVYSYLGDRAETIAVEGEPTEIELQFKLPNTILDADKDETYFEQENFDWPDEGLLMKVAANWSVDPTQLDNREDISPSLGLIGKR